MWYDPNWILRFGRDSNPRPLPWQGSILTNWTTEPNFPTWDSSEWIFLLFSYWKLVTVLPAHKSQTYSDGFVIRHLSRGPLLSNRSGINYNILEERYQTYWTPLVHRIRGGTRTHTGKAQQILSLSCIPFQHSDIVLQLSLIHIWTLPTILRV